VICKVASKEIEELESTNVFPQTSFWARIKNHQGYLPNGFQLTVSKDLLNPLGPVNHKIEDDLLILIKYVSQDQCYAYVPYGPKVEPEFENYGIFLEVLSEVLKSHLPPGCIYIKYDLPWKNQWAHEKGFYDSRGSWTGPPADNIQEFRLNFKTQNWMLQKSPSDILPTNTFFLNLNMGENELLYRMKPKTRYNIRLSLRKGVHVKEYGKDKLDDWYRLYTDTAIRNNLTLHHKEFFSSVLDHEGDSDGTVEASLLMADHEGEYLSAMFLLLSRKRGTYLYGASSSNKRHLMASYALQWEAIRRAQHHGCTEYDLFGCAPNPDQSHPLHGLYRYKQGFGGKIYHRMGCWDYPLILDDYKLIKAQEVNNQGYQA
jgi:lipid II:glycine glycyltransferase (peptidoglycan interpeptide bridge formation enzyme)